MRDDGLLFGYFETPESLKAAQAGMAQREVNERWQTMMAPYFESLDGAHPDKMMLELIEVFHTD